MSAIPDTFQPRTVYDLGCGPGNSTVLLKNRWPHATLIGLDLSQARLEEASILYPEINFVKRDITHFSPLEKIDVFFANAFLQGLDKHEILLPKLLSFINPGGVLGIQMPNNFHFPSHQVTVKILQDTAVWRSFLKNLGYGLLTTPFYKPAWYYDLLAKAGVNSLQVWETEYFQEMADYQTIFNWVKGTALRRVLSAMDSKQQAQFAECYIKAITQAYPLQANNKILLPFKRIFIVACK